MPRLLLAFQLLLVGSAAASWSDCDAVADVDDGAFGPVSLVNETKDGTLFYTLVPAPSASRPFPLVAFMHGSTGQWGMYSEQLRHLASHGFVVTFPFIKSPAADARPLTLNTDGKYLLKAIDYVTSQTLAPDSALYGTADVNRTIVAGHSMGATCALHAGLTLLREGRPVSAVYAMHPGVCGPFGPPPLPSTWTKSELTELTKALPVHLTTATNDGAFWPAPHTAEHERGCFEGGVADDAVAAVFAEFTETACAEDGDRKADGFPDGGHDCPLKKAKGGTPEWPWVLYAAKLWTQQDGAAESRCRALLLGEGADSLKGSATAINVDVRQQSA